IDHAEKLQTVECILGVFGVRQRDRRIETNRQQALDLAVMNRIHDFLSGVAGLRQILRLDTPDTGHVLASSGIMDRTRARQLVAFLAVLAASLTVALAG